MNKNNKHICLPKVLGSSDGIITYVCTYCCKTTGFDKYDEESIEINPNPLEKDKLSALLSDGISFN
ncbi:hypothetical protein CMI39_01125 [Candidatus Pacearchaeota archaeon]|jgi:hypothetical protein|nr:hypothetical protein [Candidatus Pacearchaeota archaeon]|tara:strand:- start:2744 stop:2941 length:198 start_codon:yes stop_codon:yes gene_type:complete